MTQTIKGLVWVAASFKPALYHLTEAYRQRDGNADILRSLYALDRVNNRHKDSLDRVTAALAKNPDNAKLHRLRGILALDMGRVSDAERAFEKARVPGDSLL